MTDAPRNTPDPEIADVLTPLGWREIAADYEGATLGGRAFLSQAGLAAILTCDVIEGRRWIHLSVSRRQRTPSYEDITFARRSFLGTSEPAYQVFPRSTEHVNVHDYCLHLWRCLDADPFPDSLGERSRTIG